MAIYFGSARSDENGGTTGSTAGDQKQTSTPDYSGEVSMQEMYTHSKGWYIMRPKNVDIANKIADLTIQACNNKHIGYSQGSNSRTGRYGVVNYGVNSTTDIGADCSSLMREVVKEASGIDPGDFTTDTEVKYLKNTELFETKVAYVNQSTTPVFNGDLLITQSKGHTGAIVSGNPRSVEGWVQDSTGWWYRNSDGTWPHSCWKVINNHWYYFGSSGYMKTGWQYLNGEWFYLEENNNDGFQGACWHEKSKGNGALERWYVE